MTELKYAKKWFNDNHNTEECVSEMISKYFKGHLWKRHGIMNSQYIHIFRQEVLEPWVKSISDTEMSSLIRNHFASSYNAWVDYRAISDGDKFKLFLLKQQDITEENHEISIEQAAELMLKENYRIFCDVSNPELLQKVLKIASPKEINTPVGIYNYTYYLVEDSWIGGIVKRSEKDIKLSQIVEHNSLSNQSKSKNSHTLKCWSKIFEDMLRGIKKFDVRKNDRDYQVGDELLLEEWNQITNAYSGRALRGDVSYILHGGQFGIEEGYVVMQLENIKALKNVDNKDWLKDAKEAWVTGMVGFPVKVEILSVNFETKEAHIKTEFEQEGYLPFDELFSSENKADADLR